jgi:alginate O-acetyltransferase complex protein AlgI
MATFIIGGLWHGAGWTFVFWGLLHGLALIVQKLWEGIGFKLWTWLAWLITFNFVNIAWVFFRAKDWSDAIKVLGSMFSLDNVVLPIFLKGKVNFLNQFNIDFGGFTQNITTQAHEGKILL